MRFLRNLFNWVKANAGWLQWLAALVVLIYLIARYRGDIAVLFEERPDWSAFAVAFALCSGSLVTTYFRWYLLVRAQAFDFRFWDALRLGLVGHALSYLAPGSAGGDIFRAALIAGTQDERRLVAASTVVVDRVIGVVSLFVVGALAALGPVSALRDHNVGRIVVAVLWAGAAAGCGGLAVGLYLPAERLRRIAHRVRLPMIAGFFQHCCDSLALYQTRRGVIALTVAISSLAHVAMLSSFYFCAVALHLESAAPNLWEHWVLIPGAELAASFVPVPGGVGALEAAVTLCYEVSNEAAGGTVDPRTAQTAGLLVGLSFRVMGVAIAVIGIAAYAATRSEIKRGRPLDGQQRTPEDDRERGADGP